MPDRMWVGRFFVYVAVLCVKQSMMTALIYFFSYDFFAYNFPIPFVMIDAILATFEVTNSLLARLSAI